MTVAIASNIPITELEKVRAQYKIIAILMNKKMRVRFRGPRYDMMRLYCTKANARAFSIYFY